MADPELDAQVEKYERRVQPRTRAEIEADIEQARAVWAPKVERYNELVRRSAETYEELLQLRVDVLGYERATGDLDWEYFERLKLDGFIPALPRTVPDAVYHRYHDLRVGHPTTNNNETETDDGPDSSADFEVGEKG